MGYGVPSTCGPHAFLRWSNSTGRTSRGQPAQPRSTIPDQVAHRTSIGKPHQAGRQQRRPRSARPTSGAPKGVERAATAARPHQPREPVAPSEIPDSTTCDMEGASSTAAQRETVKTATASKPRGGSHRGDKKRREIARRAKYTRALTRRAVKDRRSAEERVAELQQKIAVLAPKVARVQRNSAARWYASGDAKRNVHMDSQALHSTFFGKARTATR